MGASVKPPDMTRRHREASRARDQYDARMTAAAVEMRAFLLRVGVTPHAPAEYAPSAIEIASREA